MSSLPIGWESRYNTMSEKDMKLGGAAANRFANKQLATQHQQSSSAEQQQSNGAYQGDTSGVYKTSDDVRAYYYQKHQSTPASTNTPALWADRQREHNLQVQQMGVFSRNQSPQAAVATTASQIDSSNRTAQSSASSSAEAALVKVATFSLESMAAALTESKRSGNSINISLKEKEEFSAAIRKAMQALSSV